MTIASEIQRIKTNIANAYDALENKGATMPATEDSANLASTVNTVSTGVSIDNTTITENASNQLQASAVMNARTGTDVLPIWQGTEQEWTNGKSTDWYNWKSDAVANVNSTTMPASKNWRAIAVGNGSTCMAISGSDKTGAYSTDGGNTWSQISLPQVNNNFSNIIFDGTYFIISYNAYDGVYYSIDGSSWAHWDLAGSGNKSKIAYGNGIYLRPSLASNTSTYNYMPSFNSSQMSTGTFPQVGRWTGVKYINNMFIVTGSYTKDGNTQQAFMTSATGKGSWTLYDTEFDAYTIAFGDGIYTVVDGGSCYYSSDLNTWNTKQLPISNSWTPIVFGGGKFLSSVYNGTTMIYSTNGIDWSISNINENTYASACYVDSKFITIGYSSIGNKVTFSESQCYTTEAEPTTASTVYSAPNTASALIITSIGTGTITLSDNNTYTYTSSGDVTTYQTIGDAYPNYLANINGVGVKIGNTLIADNTDTSALQTKSNLVTSVSSSSTDTQYPSAKLLYDTVGNIEATLDAIIAQGSNS